MALLFNILETDRLVLRRFTEADLVPFLAYRNDPDVARYQGWQVPYSEEDARVFVAEQMTMDPGQPGLWFQLALELKETGQMVGDCAFKISRFNERQAEIGYTVARPYQNRGLASEAVSRLLDYLLLELDLHRLYAITDCQNIPSVALLERLGLRREGHFIQNVPSGHGWADEYLYAILQDEWRSKQAGPKPGRSGRRGRQKKGLVIVNTGNGKGKTTAALGVMTRAWGRNMKVGIIQFIKHEKARFGEVVAGERMGLDWIVTGDGFTWTSRDMDETEARARHGWQIAQERITNGQYDILVLDEFTYPLHFGWLDTTQVIDWLRTHKPPGLHLIITGRYAPPALIDYADLVTEMREIKHPFKDQNVQAQAGIEF